MKPINNFESVQASTGEFARPTAGGYICKIVDVEDVPLNPGTQKGNYLKIEYDIADGKFAEYYKNQFARWGGQWSASFIRSYKEKAIGMFKHFTNCVEKSNKGYEWDWNEKGLIGKTIGLVLCEEDYINSNGEVKTKLSVAYIKTAEEIQNGDFIVPAPKRIKEEQKPTDDFIDIDDIVDDLPFN